MAHYSDQAEIEIIIAAQETDFSTLEKQAVESLRLCVCTGIRSMSEDIIEGYKKSYPDTKICKIEEDIKGHIRKKYAGYLQKITEEISSE